MKFNQFGNIRQNADVIVNLESVKGFHIGDTYINEEKKPTATKAKETKVGADIEVDFWLD